MNTPYHNPTSYAEVSITYSETDTKSITGVCTDMILLPHGVASPVSIEIGSDSVERVIANRPPEIRSGFNVWADKDERILVYRKRSCGEEDIEMRFFLHVFPVDPDALPKRSRQFGFDNSDFNFDPHGQRLGESCLAVRRLPKYPIAAIRTGQFTGSDFRPVWEGAFDLGESADDSKATT